jgi:PKD repeat protein
MLKTIAVRARCALFVAACAAASVAVVAAPAGAKVITDPLTHTKLGIVPSIAGSGPKAKPLSTVCTTDCTALTYTSGPVQHTETEYMLFWAPAGHPIPSAYQAGMAAWLKEVAARNDYPNNPFSVDQQYYDLSGPSGAKRFVGYTVSLGVSPVDTTPYPASVCHDTDANGNPMAVCLTQAQIASEVAKFVAANKLPTGLGDQYYVFTPPGVGSCFDSTSTSCSYTGYCGWHSTQGPAATPTLYGDMPWAYNVAGCDVNRAFGTGYANGDALDPVVGILSHEMSETMTDPELGAWRDAKGNEIGDKCAYIYGSGGYGKMTGLSNNGLGYWNVAFGTDDYLMQMEFDNHTLNCTLSSTYAQPTATVAPAKATHGVATVFTATVTDAAGVAYVTWTFGDGSAPVVTTTTSLSHTYATAGTKTLVVVVTDKNGQERRVTETVTVS